MNLKISTSDFERLKTLILKTLESYPSAQAAYKVKGHTHIRFLWDTWHATVDINRIVRVEDYLWLRGLHDYLNDSHIESALKKIIPE